MRANRPRGVPMGLNADAGLVPSADVGRNRLGVKVTRLATGVQCLPPHGNKTRSGTSPQGVTRRLANHRKPAGWAGPRTGTSRDDQKTNKPPDPMESPGTLARTRKTSARRGTYRSPMLAHETSPVSGASVVGMT
jgi:hypothetical protein